MDIIINLTDFQVKVLSHKSIDVEGDIKSLITSHINTLANTLAKRRMDEIKVDTRL